MIIENKSRAYSFVEIIWNYNETNSYSRLNEVMYEALMLAVKGLPFNDDDFININKKMRGGYWFGTNSNGKGTGEYFYSVAIKYNNKSAVKSFEKFAKIKPYISEEGHRACKSSIFLDEKYKYTVTGFNYDTGRIYLVAYDRKDYDEKGSRKLFNFDNKEWLIFRKTIKEV